MFRFLLLSLTVLFLSGCGEAHIQTNPPPVTVVIFGSTGDLTARKLFPAIYNLTQDKQLSENFALVGIGRRSLSEEDFRTSVHNALQTFSRNKPSDSSWNEFKEHIYYHEADFSLNESYENLNHLLKRIDQERGTQSNYIFYLATDSSYFPIIISKLHEHHLIHPITGSSFSRVIIEKPFGHDLDSALELQEHIAQFLDEEQIYRMDHYLGKEGVQKLFKLRFQDAHFEELFNRNFVKDIQITLSETIGIGDRANFYEKTGHLRDVVQNHAMQVLALATMEPPLHFQADTIHQEKVKVLEAIRSFPSDAIDQWVIRGQYGSGIIQNKSVLGYKQEKGVPDGSQIETFVQAKLFIDNERWQGVPVYIRSGKRLAAQTTQITLNLKENPLQIEAITIVIQPQSQVYIHQGENTLKYEIDIDSSFAQREAYENLILASIQDDQSDFVHMGEITSTWRLFTPVLKQWASNPSIALPIYEAGEWGPALADQQLTEEDISEWVKVHGMP